VQSVVLYYNITKFFRYKRIIRLRVSTNHHKWLSAVPGIGRQFLFVRKLRGFLERRSMKKPVFYTELAFFAGLILLAFGTALTAYGNAGISMVVAPAYVLHLFVSRILPWFSFGVAEYILQAVVLLVLILVLRKAKWAYLLSFGVTLLYGFVLDSCMMLTALLPENLYVRIGVYIVGAVICCNALALLFTSYFPPEAYELFSKEVSAKFCKPVHKIVNFYNLGSLLLSVVLSLVLFGDIRGIGIGTVACAFLYGFIIRFFQTVYEKLFCFEDKLPWRRYFEESEKKQ